MKKIILFVFLWSNLSIALGQRTSVKTQPTGSGPVLSGVSIVHTKIGVDPTKVRFEKRMPTYNVVNLKFSLNGNVSSYRYKGKTYQTYYPNSGNVNDCPGAILNNAKGPSMGLSVKATIVIRVNRQTYTQTTTTIATAGVYHFRFTLDEYVQEQFVDAKNIVSITVEPVPISYFENQLDRMEQCKERKEKEKKDKELQEKEVEGQQTTQKDDDFWAGGEETKLTLGNSDTKETTKNTKDDFWSGSEAKSNDNNSDFWAAGNNSSNGVEASDYKIRKEDGYSWVESESGKILIPKGSYDIQDYKDGLARVRKTTGTDYFSELGTITLYEYSYINEKGVVIPPIRKTISIPGNFSNAPLIAVYRYPDETYEQRRAREKREEEERKRRRAEEAKRREQAIQSVKSKYRAMGYDVD